MEIFDLKFWAFSSALIYLFVGSVNAAESHNGMDRSIQVVARDVQRLTGCANWKGGVGAISSQIPQTRALMILTRAENDGTVETAEILALVAGDPRRPDAGRASQETVARIVKLLVPGWRNATIWLRAAAKRVVNGKSGGGASIGKLTILVLRVQPADVPGIFMDVIVTKKTSFEQLGSDD